MIFFLAASVLLKNDSTYTLNAELFDKNLEPLTKMTLGPNSFIKWTETTQNRAASIVEGPFAVLWTCPSGAEFGVNYKIADGTVCNAKSASGTRRCSPQEKQ